MPDEPNGNKQEVAHLFDAGAAADIAAWLLNNVVAPGAVGIGSAYIYDRLKGLKDRHGQAKVREVETETRRLSDDLGEGGPVNRQEREQRIDSIFIKFK